MPKKRPSKLTIEDTGSCTNLASRPNPDNLQIVFSPSLSSILHRATEAKGSPLTKSEVERILAKVPAIAVTKEQAVALANNRGYDDIDPTRSYEHWIELHDENRDA